MFVIDIDIDIDQHFNHFNPAITNTLVPSITSSVVGAAKTCVAERDAGRETSAVINYGKFQHTPL